VHASYTLSRSYLDGVGFFLTTRGTQRPPWSIESSGVARLISGSPIKVQSGVDLDGDTIITGDLPAGIPITVGRERVAETPIT